MGAPFSFGFSVVHAQVSVTPSLVSTTPQIVDGGPWVTTMALTNTSANATEVTLNFYQETGGGATQPWLLDFVEVTSAQPQAVSLPAGSTLFLHTLGTAAATTVGWGQVSWSPTTLPSVIDAYAIFTQRIPGRPDEEGTAEAIPVASRFLVPFDNTNGAVTSIAIASLSTNNNFISVGIRTRVCTTQPAAITLPPLGHTSFAFPTQFPGTAGQTGLAEFYGSSTAISIIGLRFNSGAFTTAPVYSVTGAPIIIGSTLVQDSF